MSKQDRTEKPEAAPAHTDEGAQPDGFLQRMREGRSYFLTVLVVTLLLLLGGIIYLLKYWPMQFLYMLF